jgi:hypothetical protein
LSAEGSSLLTTREQLAFLVYPCVKKGICKREDLHLERFENQEVAVVYSSPSSPRASGTFSSSALSSGRIG